MEIIPINGHLLIKPKVHQTFLPTEKSTFEEVGEIVDIAGDITQSPFYMKIKKGDTVFYDSWLAAKYPTGEDDNYFWLVPYKDVRAIQKNGI